jgi:hypothetical protein
MQPSFHGDSSGPGDARDLLSVLLEPCAEYIALGWSLERVVLVWRERPHRTTVALVRSPGVASASVRRGGSSNLSRARNRAHKAFRAGTWEATAGFVRPGGRRFAMQVLIAPIRDTRGRSTGFVVISQHHADPLHRGRVQEAGGEAPRTIDAPLQPATPALRFESVSCQTVVRQVANALRHMAKRMGLQFETKLPRRDLVVLTDRRALTDILLSMTNHAIGLTGRGKIRLEAVARRDDQGRRFSEIRVVGGTVAGTGAPRPQTIGQELAMRLGGRIDVDYERGRRSAFALVLPDMPPRRQLSGSGLQASDFRGLQTSGHQSQRGLHSRKPPKPVV